MQFAPLPFLRDSLEGKRGERDALILAETVSGTLPAVECNRTYIIGRYKSG